MIDKLKRIQVQEKLKNMELEVFTPKEFQGVFDVPSKTASMFILNNVKSGLFHKLPILIFKPNSKNSCRQAIPCISKISKKF